MSGHSGICIRAVGSAQDTPPRAARPAAFVPAAALRAGFDGAHEVAAVFAAAAVYDGIYAPRFNLTAVFAPAAAL